MDSKQGQLEEVQLLTPMADAGRVDGKLEILEEGRR